MYIWMHTHGTVRSDDDERGEKLKSAHDAADALTDPFEARGDGNNYILSASFGVVVGCSTGVVCFCLRCSVGRLYSCSTVVLVVLVLPSTSTGTVVLVLVLLLVY